MTGPTILLLAAMIGGAMPLRAPAPASRSVARFDSGHSARGIPVEIIGEGLVFVRAKVRDVEVWLLLDTSSPSVLSRKLAGQVGLAPTQGVPGAGMEEGESPIRVLKDVAVRLPGVELSQPSVSSFDLDPFQTMLGHRVDGILGAPFFESLVVELDYARAQISVWDPGSYRFPGQSAAIAVKVEAGLPYLEGTLTLPRKPPFAGTFLLDTGADNAVILFSHFVDAHALLGDAARITPEAGAAKGLGNLEAVVRAQELKIGSFRFQEPVVQLSRSTQGLLADVHHAGLIGGAVLSRFRVTLDLPHGRLWLEKNRRYGEPFLHDASGLSLVAQGPDLSTLLIRRVSPGSPGEEAGFALGDVLIAVDGKPIKDVGLREVRRLLELDGRQYILTIFRKGEIRKLTITCRRRL